MTIMFPQHTQLACTNDLSQHGDRRRVSQYMGKQSDLCYLFENVTVI